MASSIIRFSSIMSSFSLSFSAFDSLNASSKFPSVSSLSGDLSSSSSSGEFFDALEYKSDSCNALENKILKFLAIN